MLHRQALSWEKKEKKEEEMAPKHSNQTPLPHPRRSHLTVVAKNTNYKGWTLYPVTTDINSLVLLQVLEIDRQTDNRYPGDRGLIDVHLHIYTQIYQDPSRQGFFPLRFPLTTAAPLQETCFHSHHTSCPCKCLLLSNSLSLPSGFIDI